MEPIGPPDIHYLSAAIGWLELGNGVEARAELAQIGPGLREHPDVLETRWLICVRQELWEEGLEVARALLRQAPDRVTGWLHRAYALRRIPSGGLRQAWKALLPAYDKFPEESTVPYNLACYACQMQDLHAARVWLTRATDIGGAEPIKLMALADSDLEPLWEELHRL